MTRLPDPEVLLGTQGGSRATVRKALAEEKEKEKKSLLRGHRSWD